MDDFATVVGATETSDGFGFSTRVEGEEGMVSSGPKDGRGEGEVMHHFQGVMHQVHSPNPSWQWQMKKDKSLLKRKKESFV